MNIDNKDDYSSKIKSFIKKWQSFALYHDVGYYFEDKNIYKKVSKAMNVFIMILYIVV